MQELDDNNLLRQYTEQNSEEAFAAIVARHINKVYSTALRHTRNPSQAEEITQAVFVILAKKARTLSRHVVLSGWLYQTARLASVTFLRSEIRRARREQEVHIMQNILNEPVLDETWKQMAPLLDAAMANLNEADRNAVILRFFDGKSLQEVGTALGFTEDASKKRVSRALEKLRNFFTKRGVVSTTAIIAGAISNNSVQAAPVALANSVTAAIAKGATASASTLTLVKGASKLMAWTKAKTAILVGAAAILAVGTSTMIVIKATSPTYPSSWADHPSYWRLENPPLASYPSVLILRPTRFSGHGGGIGIESLFSARFLERDAGIEDLVAIAYHFPHTRIIFPDDIPQSHTRQGYDLMLTLRINPRKALRDAIAKQFGLVGHTETMVTNVFLVRVANPDAPGLKPAASGPKQQPGWFDQNWSLTIDNQPLDIFLGEYIESQVGQPVLNKTGLTGRYNLHIEWRPQAGETDKSAFEQAFHEQLGLELVPTKMPVEMLIVEKKE